MLHVSRFGTGVFFCTSLLLGCEPPHDHEPDGPEPLGEAISAISVQEAMNGSCSTASVKGLSLQIIAQSACIAPGSFVEVPAEPNIHFSNTVLPYLEQPARDALVAALQGSPGMDLNVNSMLRTVAQQYLLYQWYLNGLCGIPLAATPGNSNHETGLALDIDEYTAWKSALTANGFKWYGSADVYHYDYVGPGAVNYKGTDVLAFQMLWNINHPEDLIAEDGDYGPQTEARLKKSPAEGFPKGANCSEKPPKPDIQLTLTMLDADDSFSDGASKDRIDLVEARNYTLEITVSNTGNAPADNVQLSVTMPGPYAVAGDYFIETDFGHPGTFEENDANSDPSNPSHETPLGNEFGFKLNAFSKGETKRITIPVLSGESSIESESGPDIHLWVNDVPGAYHQETFDGPADNVENSQTFNGGSLQLPLGIDVYSPTRWEWNTDRREGWESTNSGVVVAKPDFGVLSVSLPDSTFVDGPLAVGPVLDVSADDLTGFEISGRSDAGTLTVYFTTDLAPDFSKDKSFQVSLPAGEGFTSDTVSAASHADWTGQLTRLAFGVSEGAAEVNSLKLVSVPNAGEGGAGGNDINNGQGGVDIDRGKPMCSCDLPGGSTQREISNWMWVGLALAALSRRRKQIPSG